MKTNKKTFINIANLVNQQQRTQKEGKKVVTYRDRPRSHQNMYQEDFIEKENFCNVGNVNRKVSLKLDVSASRDEDTSVFGNTDRSSPAHGARENTVVSKSFKKSEGKQVEKHRKLKQLQSLMVSQKMFIDPQRWQNFLDRSKSDPKFHKALSAFMYSYFIQNYQ